MKRGILAGIIVVVAGIMLSGCSSNSKLFSGNGDYASLPKADKNKVAFTFKIRQSGSSPAAPYYAINATIKNNSKRVVKINQEDLKIIGAGKANPKPAKSGTLTIKSGKEVTIKNLFKKLSGQAIIGSNLLVW